MVHESKALSVHVRAWRLVLHEINSILNPVLSSGRFVELVVLALHLLGILDSVLPLGHFK
jgi:hypothetical protein